MTSARVIRGTKAKIFLYVCGILIITGLIACYNNTLSQLEDVKKSKEICQQQQENLSTQLQVISDYKQKLEKSLKNEKADHQQLRSNLEVKINEEKSKNEKLTSDALLKYNSLQQHFSLLQTQHDDFKEECAGNQKKQLVEINSLQLKLKEVEEELKKVKASKESIKTQYTEMEMELQKLKISLNHKDDNNEAQKRIRFFSDNLHDLEDKYKALQEKCGEKSPEHPIEEPQNKPSEGGVLNKPSFDKKPVSSTKEGQNLSSSQGSLNGARPLNVPSVTPETVKKEANLKPPQGVPGVPEDRENQNEQPDLQFKKKLTKDDPENDNAAHEEFDPPHNLLADGLSFGDDNLKQGNNAKKIADTLDAVPKKTRDEQEYKDREEEVDDDVDDYVDQHARQEDPAVRQ